MDTLLAQAEGYTGASHPGLNPQASYHRMVYENRESVLGFNEARALTLSLLEQFQSSGRSRLVIRLLLTGDEIGYNNLDGLVDELGGTLGAYQNFQPGTPLFYYCTISFNNRARNPNPEVIKNLVLHNRSYVDKITEKVGDFEDFSVERIGEFTRRNLHVTHDMSPDEMVGLWGDTFGWSYQACEDLLGSSDGSFALGVRSHTNELIAIVLYSHQPHMISSAGSQYQIQHGETTEASTKPEYQGNGVMPILVGSLHAVLVERDIHNVYGELRAEDLTGDKPNSINHGVKSGKVFMRNSRAPNILVNHVSIGGRGESYNIGREIPGYNSSPPAELRTFLVGYMDPAMFTPRVRAAYSRIIK